MQYLWNIEQIEVCPEKDGKQNIVAYVFWKLTAEDGQFTSSHYGSSFVPFDKDGEFTDYNNLTKDEIVGWVKEAIGDDEISNLKKMLSESIDSLKNPPTVILPLPW